MKTMTQGQKNQILARLTLELQPKAVKWEAAQMAAKDDPEFTSRFVEFLNTYERRVIFERVAEVAFLGTKKPFIVADHFDDKKFYLGSNFRAWMLPKTEIPQGSSKLLVEKVLRTLTDSEIIAAKGGEKEAETSLAEIAHLVSLQPNGPKSPKGTLLTDGSENRFLVPDISGVLREVHVCWKDDRWFFFALELGDFILSEGNHVVFRN